MAHDFNNLLTVINGYSRLLLGSLKAGDPLRDGLEEIHKAGERAAGLTQQLLAFSRKQVLQPRVLDLNRVVEEMRPMLARLMGEDVEVCVQLHAEAATIRADPHQLEQVLMNLAVNSRDAMPHGGKFSIETGFVEWGESQVQSRPGAQAGPYVMLAVSDTGVGMNEETRGHIFEPFFTTKEVGKGTGLGLSTIHGIVEQSGGYVEVASELGRGTTFKIYLPRVADAQADSGKPEAVPAMGGKETVLVVEDQAEVRRYAAAALRAYGYQVMRSGERRRGAARLRAGERAHRPDLDRRGDAGLERQGTGRPAEATPAGDQSAVHVGLHRRHHRAPWGSAEGRGVYPEAIQLPSSWPSRVREMLAAADRRPAGWERRKPKKAIERPDRAAAFFRNSSEAPRFIHKFATCRSR